MCVESCRCVMEYLFPTRCCCHTRHSVRLWCYRPQILILAKLDDQLIPRYGNMFAFASQLKAGKGLIIAASVLEGKFVDKVGEVAASKQVKLVTAIVHRSFL